MKLKEEKLFFAFKVKESVKAGQEKGYTNDLQHREMVKDISTK